MCWGCPLCPLLLQIAFYLTELRMDYPGVPDGCSSFFVTISFLFFLSGCTGVLSACLVKTCCTGLAVYLLRLFLSVQDYHYEV